MRMNLMQAAACAVLLALAAPAAFAQGSSRAPNIDQSKMDDSIRSYQDAVKYYQSGQIGLAEKELEKFLGKVGEHAGGNFLMGMVQVQQGNLEKARTSFKTTVKLDPAMVSPKGWLGAIEAALGNLPGAAAQKGELEKLKAACAGTCPKSAEIDEGIQRIDANVAAVTQAQKPG
jgi:predicted Zn-dependent protease